MRVARFARCIQLVPGRRYLFNITPYRVSLCNAPYTSMFRYNVYFQQYARCSTETKSSTSQSESDRTPIPPPINPINPIPPIYKVIGGIALIFVAAVVGIFVPVVVEKVQEYNLVDSIVYRPCRRIRDDRNYRKFRSMQLRHIPPVHVPFKIDRSRIIDRLNTHISSSCAVNTVINIIAPKELGKSVVLIEVAKRIDQDTSNAFKVFYVNCANSMKRAMVDHNKLVYSDEKSAVNGFFRNIFRYTHEDLEKGKRVIVIMDSPGGIHGDECRDIMTIMMKELVAAGEVTFYCVTSPPNKVFTQERKAKLGKGRYTEYTAENWGIDFSLTSDEMMMLINQFQKQLRFTFTDDELGQLMLKRHAIGEFVNAMGRLKTAKDMSMG